MTAAVLTPVVAGDPTQYAALAAALALLVGAIRLLSGLARLGFPANLLSRPVLVGYMTGIAIVMIVSWAKLPAHRYQVMDSSARCALSRPASAGRIGRRSLWPHRFWRYFCCWRTYTGHSRP